MSGIPFGVRIETGTAKLTTRAHAAKLAVDSSFVLILMSGQSWLLLRGIGSTTICSNK